MKNIFLVLCFLLAFNTTNGQNYSTHKIKQGETIESISKLYNVSPFDIYSLNPDAKNELKVNSVLIIPKSKISTEPKVTVERKLNGFKRHRVKRQETLYSISKRYDVSEEDIKKHNTFLYANNLRKGDNLQIPVYIEVKTTETTELTKKYTVLAKEGKWRIAYKFGITINELEALNPDMKEVLQEGDLLNVPNIETNDQREIDDTYGYYKVLPKEGFYRLKLKLGIDQDELEALNPGLDKSGLKEGMILKVPYSAVASISEIEDLNTDHLTSKINDFGQKHIAIMLPFRLNRVTFDSIAETKNQIKRDPYLNTSLDFYSGVLVALDSLKKLGINLKVDVYDTKNQLSEVQRIINSNNFEDVDAVIGPLMPNNLNKAALELSGLNIPVISPNSKSIQLYDNVFQTMPSDDLLKNKVIEFVKKDSLKDNVIIISDSKNVDVSNALKREFNFAPQVFSRKNKDGKDANYVLVDDIKLKLKPGRNIVFLETQNVGFASNVTSILNSLIQEEDFEKKQVAIDIVLVTTNYNTAFESDEVSNYNLSKLQFHFGTASKSYDEDQYNTFVKTYLKQYDITPNKKAVRGFDLTMDVVLRLVTSENLYMSAKDTALTEYVENKFAYKKKLFGGYYNDTVYLVKYQNLKIVEVE
ncbi:LysM peptidoglycan-binding domain-containing protein [Yeosuana sp. MJ-SS3]|uniref:LysM peptidoglycan-binding domain-containing protein n=1 Tax=Gilvirhabdus luticola TaxID=3079858 RepID=A0ABU3U539_9FLAO|nr:LysM peptidoglycan-binding domain-containing protein [Yeosuana sp. MJ-SS3]MDU8885529.1 LysM peptidoglycan-binding domain-containing protein [Yeosuana sp. MJ-SS3]